MKKYFEPSIDLLKFDVEDVTNSDKFSKVGGENTIGFQKSEMNDNELINGNQGFNNRGFFGE